MKSNEKQLTMATVNEVIYKYNRHMSNNSILNLLINQDTIKGSTKAMESKGESLRAEIEELVDYVSTNNVTKLLDNDQDYKSGFRDLVLKLNDMVTQQGEMYERIKGADAAFGNMHKFDFFVNELESIDKNINNLDFLNDMDSIEESI